MILQSLHSCRDVSRVNHFSGMFKYALSFSRKLCWALPAGASTTYMFSSSGGGSTDASCVYECTPKTNAPEWAAVGCVVSGDVTGTKRSELGDGT